MGSAERQNGPPNPATVPDNGPTKDHTILKGMSRGIGKAARSGGRAAYRGATYVPRQTARAGKDFLIGKRRKHAGRVLVAGALLTVAGGTVAVREGVDFVQNIDVPGLHQSEESPEIFPAFNPEQENQLQALVDPYFHSELRALQSPDIRYSAVDKGKSGFHIDNDGRRIDITINTTDAHDDLLTAQILANTAAIEYLDEQTEGALSAAADAEEEKVTDFALKTALDSHLGDRLSPTKKAFADEDYDWDAGRAAKVITTARLMPDQLLAIIAAAEQVAYGEEADAMKLVLKTQLHALDPVLPVNTTLPDYLRQLGVDERVIQIAFAA